MEHSGTLIFESDDLIRLMLKVMCSTLGNQAVLSNSITAFEERLANEKFETIVFDLDDQSDNATQALVEASEYASKHRARLILTTTAPDCLTIGAEVQELRKITPDIQVLSKPFTANELKASLQRQVALY